MEDEESNFSFVELEQPENIQFALPSKQKDTWFWKTREKHELET